MFKNSDSVAILGIGSNTDILPLSRDADFIFQTEPVAVSIRYVCGPGKEGLTTNWYLLIVILGCSTLWEQESRIKVVMQNKTNLINVVSLV